MSELENSRSELKCKLSGAGDDGENKSKQIERLQRKVFLLTKVRMTVLIWFIFMVLVTSCQTLFYTLKPCLIEFYKIYYV